MEFKPSGFCPLLNSECINLKCNWFAQVRGKNKSGKDIDEWGCSISWLPHLMIENISQNIKSVNSTKKFKQEMVDINDKKINAMIAISELESQIQNDIKESTYEANNN